MSTKEDKSGQYHKPLTQIACGEMSNKCIGFHESAPAVQMGEGAGDVCMMGAGTMRTSMLECNCVRLRDHERDGTFASKEEVLLEVTMRQKHACDANGKVLRGFARARDMTCKICARARRRHRRRCRITHMRARTFVCVTLMRARSAATAREDMRAAACASAHAHSHSLVRAVTPIGGGWRRRCFCTLGVCELLPPPLVR